MGYVTVFDAATAVFSGWYFVASGILVTTISGVALLRHKGPGHLLEGDPQSAARGCFSLLFFLFAFAWTIVVLATGIPRYLDLKNASLNNECTSVAGVVTNFVPMGPGGNEPYESFTVNDARFSYSRFNITGGYNRFRGPVREGLWVRICYVDGVRRGDNVIVRLEIRRS